MRIQTFYSKPRQYQRNLHSLDEMNPGGTASLLMSAETDSSLRQRDKLRNKLKGKENIKYCSGILLNNLKVIVLVKELFSSHYFQFSDYEK